MRYYEFAKRQHSRTQHDPRKVASLFVMKGEAEDCKAMVRRFGGEIVGAARLPVIPAQSIKVLCPSSDAAFDLGAAWLAYMDTSPHRPHIEEERVTWGEKHAPIKGVPSDWTFR